MSKVEAIKKLKRDFKKIVKEQDEMLSLPLTEEERKHLPSVHSKVISDLLNGFQEKNKVSDEEMSVILEEIQS